MLKISEQEVLEIAAIELLADAYTASTGFHAPSNDYYAKPRQTMERARWRLDNLISSFGKD